MKKVTRMLAALAAATTLTVSAMPISSVAAAEHSSYQVQLLTDNGYVEVNAGKVFDEIISAVNFGHADNYKIFVPTGQSHLGSYTALTPRYTIAFELDENVSEEQAEEVLKPILEKYDYPLDFHLGEQSLYVSEVDYKDIESGALDINMVKEQSEALMNELKETGIVARFYPLGSMYEQHALSGFANIFSTEYRETLEEYVQNSLTGFTLGENDDCLVLSGDSSKSLQDEFDAVAKIYEDTGIRASFGSYQVGMQPVGYGVELLGENDSTSPVNTNAALKGDADLNGEVGLSDLVAVSKYNVNSTAYPLANETAEANADMNNDNVVDGLDTQALVEYNLGKK